MKKLFYTYTLIDPRTNEVKYVGATHDPEKRLYSHIKTKEGTQLKRQWIKDLLSNGLSPVMDIIESFDSVELATEGEKRLYDLHILNGELFCDDPKIRAYKPNLVEKHKHMITVKVTPGIDELLKKLAKKENRSQGQQIEKLINDECKKLDVK